ncbi:AEC family transporter [Nitratifractor sp.]
METTAALGGVYLFIALGFAAKKFFAGKLDESSLVLVSIYFLQPFLVFWGITRTPIDRHVAAVPLAFGAFSLLFLALAYPAARAFFVDPKRRSVAVVTAIVGNTGNLGIPVGIALFGESSVIYTSIVNLVNVFVVYTVGVYFYSQGRFSIAQSLGNILRLPAIWFGLGALAFNLSGPKVPEALELPLRMGAYATMVLQLMIFGVYLARVRARSFDRRLLGFVVAAKYLAIPLAAWALLPLWGFSGERLGVLILELLVPTAVMNVNLAALYDCRPEETALVTFATSLVFLALMLLGGGAMLGRV